MRWATAVAIVVALTPVLVSGSGAGASFPGANGKLVLGGMHDVGSDLRSDIFTVNADGSGLTQVTTDGVSVAPAWSPDGTKIAFERSIDQPQQVQVTVMNADGSGATGLTSGASDHQPAWSPDGAQIAFSRWVNPGEPRPLMVMGASGGNPQQVAPDGAYPSWAPDGSAIAYAQVGVTGISTVHPDGTGHAQLTTDKRNLYPDWRPDSARLVFTQAAETSTNTIIGRDGSQPTSLGPNTGNEPVWSPDCKHIAAYDRAASGDMEILVLDTSGAVTDRFPLAGVDQIYGLDWQRAGSAAADCSDGPPTSSTTTAGSSASTSTTAEPPASTTTTVQPATTTSTTAAPTATVSCAGGPAVTVSPASVTAGASVVVTGRCLPAGTAVTVTMHSAPVLLGTVTTDGRGAFSTTVHIPADAAPGAHSLIVEGGGVQASSPVQVAAATSEPSELPRTGGVPFGLAGLLTLVTGAALRLGRR